MTRGKIAVITPDGDILTSVEFNGGMYIETGGLGQEVFKELNLIETVKEYTALVKMFNTAHFGYAENLFYDAPKNYLDMKHHYPDKWGSDYVYIKNLSESPVVFTDNQGKKIRIDNDTTAVFYFGDFFFAGESNFDRLMFIEKLKPYKQKPVQDYDKGFSEIWEMCSEYDCLNDCVLTSLIESDLKFVPNELLDRYETVVLPNGSTNLIEKNYDAENYRMDEHGNLKKITKADFEELIDYLIDFFQEEMQIHVKEDFCL